MAKIFAQFLISYGQSYDTSCLSSIPIPDYDGSDAATQTLSMQYFGVRDLWNDGMLYDPTSITSTGSYATQYTASSAPAPASVCSATTCPAVTCPGYFFSLPTPPHDTITLATPPCIPFPLSRRPTYNIPSTSLP